MGKNIDFYSELKWFPVNRTQIINLVGGVGGFENEQNQFLGRTWLVRSDRFGEQIS